MGLILSDSVWGLLSFFFFFFFDNTLFNNRCAHAQHNLLAGLHTKISVLHTGTSVWGSVEFSLYPPLSSLSTCNPNTWQIKLTRPHFSHLKKTTRQLCGDVQKYPNSSCKLINSVRHFD